MDLTWDELTSLPIGTKLIRTNGSPITKGAEYELLDVHPNNDRVKVRRLCSTQPFVVHTKENHVRCHRTFKSADPYAAVAASMNTQAVGRSQRSNVNPHLAAPYGQVPPPGYKRDPVEWKTLHLGMELECSMNGELYVVYALNRKSNGYFEIELHLQGNSFGMNSRVFLGEHDFNQHQWFETHRSFGSKISQQVKQATTRMMNRLDTMMEPELKFNVEYDAVIKKKCTTHNWFKDYVSMFDPSMDKYSCKICGVKKEDVV